MCQFDNYLCILEQVHVPIHLIILAELVHVLLIHLTGIWLYLSISKMIRRLLASSINLIVISILIVDSPFLCLRAANTRDLIYGQPIAVVPLDRDLAGTP
jgi:hypothetical protein